MQKFKRGNLVKVLKEKYFPYSTSLDSKDLDNTAIIEGSYADLFWGSNRSEYSIIFLKSGRSLAWVNESEIELIEEGSEHLFEQAEKNRIKNISEYTNLESIIQNWNNKQAINSYTISFLFDKVGFKSSFDRNGEFFILFCDYYRLHSLFDMIMNSNDLQNVLNLLKPETENEVKDNVISFFNEVQFIKKKSY